MTDIGGHAKPRAVEIRTEPFATKLARHGRDELRRRGHDVPEPVKECTMDGDCDAPEHIDGCFGGSEPSESVEVAVYVRLPDPENPSPALIEAAYIAQDDLSKPPDQWAIRAAAEVIQSYIDAQNHTTVHVLGHQIRR